jgi:NlpC/P60 family putative phage cell wall peptidase
MIQQRIVDLARLWLGTPYLHQGSLRGAGTDCLGLLRGLWREVYGTEPQDVPAYSADWSEASGDEVLWRAAGRWLQAKPLDQDAAGDVLLFRMRAGGIAKHLGIQSATTPATFIHAYTGHGVIESALTTPWRRKLVARFSFPSGA